MPMPTDRYGRFVVRQRKYRRRYERWRRARRRIEYKSGFPHLFREASDWTLAGDGSKQQGHGLKSAGQNGPLLPWFQPGWHRHFAPAAYRKPPTVAVHWNVTHTKVFTDLHPYHAYVGYQVRRSRYFGKKINRNSDGKRKPRAINYARGIYSRSGEWPEWAPREWALPGTIFPPDP